MSLDFDFTDMIERLGREEYDRITDHPSEEGKWHPVTDALIWSCLILGLPGINEKTVDTFITRMAAMQAISPSLHNQDGAVYITEEDIRNHMGLSTNCSKDSDAAFAKKLVGIAAEEGKRKERLQGKSAFEVAAND